MAERDGFANPLPSPPLGIEAVGPAAGSNAETEFFVVSCEGVGNGGPAGRGIPLGSPARGLLISGSGGGGLSSSSDSEERAESGDGGSSKTEGGSPKAIGTELTSKGRVRGALTGLGVTSLSGSSGILCCAMAGSWTNVNVNSVKTEKERTSGDGSGTECDTLEGITSGLGAAKGS